MAMVCSRKENLFQIEQSESRQFRPRRAGESVSRALCVRLVEKASLYKETILVMLILSTLEAALINAPIVREDTHHERPC